MMCPLRNRFSGVLLTIMCLAAAVALSSNPVDAQGSHRTQKVGDHYRATPPQKDFKFETASIRPVKPGTEKGGTNLLPSPNGYHTNLSVWQMIMAAYVPGYIAAWGSTQVLNAPKWLSDGKELYEIDARVADEDLDAWQHQGLGRELLHSALQNVLKERCKLVIHMQPKDVPDYELVIAKKGPKLIENAPDPKLPPYGPPLPGGGYISVTQRQGRRIAEEYVHGVTMEELCLMLSQWGRPVHDKTGLTGRYDFRLRSDPSDGYDDRLTPWRLDLLGLDLKPGKYKGFSIVIDHVEKPDAN